MRHNILYLMIFMCTMILSQPTIADDMVYIADGDFLMGSNEGNAPQNQHPQHQVFLKEYHLAVHEVTNREYEQFILAGGYSKKELWSPEGWKFITENRIVIPAAWKLPGFRNPDYPVVGVSWYEAEAFAAWAKKRLPTEAEWEKAARSTGGRLYPWGNRIKTGVGYRAFSRPYIVGSFLANKSSYGIYDMAGNVWEWVLDYYDKDYYKKAPTKNPRGPAHGSQKVLRGGGWGCNRRQLQVTYRRAELPTWRGLDTGFRLAQD